LPAVVHAMNCARLIRYGGPAQRAALRPAAPAGTPADLEGGFVDSEGAECRFQLPPHVGQIDAEIAQQVGAGGHRPPWRPGAPRVGATTVTLLFGVCVNDAVILAADGRVAVTDRGPVRTLTDTSVKVVQAGGMYVAAFAGVGARGGRSVRTSLETADLSRSSPGEVAADVLALALELESGAQSVVLIGGLGTDGPELWGVDTRNGQVAPLFTGSPDRPRWFVTGDFGLLERILDGVDREHLKQAVQDEDARAALNVLERSLASLRLDVPWRHMDTDHGAAVAYALVSTAIATLDAAVGIQDGPTWAPLVGGSISLGVVDRYGVRLDNDEIEAAHESTNSTSRLTSPSYTHIASEVDCADAPDSTLPAGNSVLVFVTRRGADGWQAVAAANVTESKPPGI